MRSLPVLVVSLSLAACGAGEGERRPNVILISIDTLRRDHVGCYGYERPTTPAIDRFASEGVLFEDHVSSSSWTLPAHAALFTSVADSVHGCVESTGTALSPAFTTLAERFRAGGYETAGFYAGPYLHEAFGLGQGFDTYDFCSDTSDAFPAQRVAEWGMSAAAQGRSHQGVTNPLVYSAAREWMGDQEDEPFFLFLHFWDVHYDFTPPPPWDTKFNPGYTGPVDGRNFFFDPKISADMPEEDKLQLLALYDGEIGWTDTWIDRLRTDLEALGIEDETVVVITSDHGTEFFEHGRKGHRISLYDELIRVPLIVWYPSGLTARRVEAQTRSIDVGPTLLELADLPSPDDVMGHSLVGLARGQALDFDNRAVSELFSVGRRLRSVRDGKTKFLLNERAAPEKIVRWYDLTADPGELRPSFDLSAGLGARAERNYLEAKLLLEAAIARRPGDSVVPDIPDDVADDLKGHGYLQDEDEDEDD